MVNPFTLIKDLYDASQAGQEMANAAAWADRAHAVAIVTTLLTALLGLLGQFHVVPDGINLTDEDVKAVALGVAAIGTPIANFLHKASNRNAGGVH